MLCGLIGAGIQGSLSPALQEEEARHHGLRLHYQLIDLEASRRGVSTSYPPSSRRRESWASPG